MNELSNIDLAAAAANLRKLSVTLKKDINVDAAGKNLEALGPQALKKLGETAVGLQKMEDYGRGFGPIVGKMDHVDKLVQRLNLLFSSQKDPNASKGYKRATLEDIRREIEDFGSSEGHDRYVTSLQGSHGSEGTITFDFTFNSGEPLLRARSIVMDANGELDTWTFDDDDLRSFNQLADFQNYVLKEATDSAISPLLKAVSLLGELSKNVDRRISIVGDGSELRQLGGSAIRKLNETLECLKGIDRYGKNFKELYANTINVRRLISNINGMHKATGEDREKAIQAAKSLIERMSPNTWLGAKKFKVDDDRGYTVARIYAYKRDGDVFLGANAQRFRDGKWSEVKSYSEAQILALGSPAAFGKMALEGPFSFDRPQPFAGLSDTRIAIAGDVLPPVRTHGDDDRSKPQARLNDFDLSANPSTSLPSIGQSRLGQLVQSLTSFGAQQDGIDRATARILPLPMASLSLATPS
ncbi:hypothetical protein [Pandoraea sp. PE-S2R-1]|uniref:hypothetical protein n=1 Tax=Pandoraea sp. PE-S2R-1 TaxID=1986994 RepID=UPI000B3F8DDE|nr:hypothetical protein [Pandoraea sp. PE-S2R-1]